MRPAGGRRSRFPRLIASGALVAVLLTVAPVAAQGRTGTTVPLNVTFFADSTISVALADGTPVGTTSGAPTVIAAGYYTVVMTGPGGCTVLPHFDLKGPGEAIFDNMTEGEVPNETIAAYFQPNATYTWRNDAFPTVIHTFKTSAEIVGTAPVQPKSGYSSGKGGTARSWDLVGSANAVVRGTLTGAVSATGRLSLAFKGKSVTSLTAGRYKITVTDRSATSGFLLEKVKHAPVTVTAARFVGKRSVGVKLTAGRWLFLPSPGKTAYSIVVKNPAT